MVSTQLTSNNAVSMSRGKCSIVLLETIMFKDLVDIKKILLVINEKSKRFLSARITLLVI